MSNFSPKVRKYKGESVSRRIVFSCLIGACCVFLLFLQQGCIDAILDDRAFLDRAIAFAIEQPAGVDVSEIIVRPTA